MTRADVSARYAIRGDRVCAPRFPLQRLHVPALWDRYERQDYDHGAWAACDCVGVPGCVHPVTFEVTPVDQREFPPLRTGMMVQIYQDARGIVREVE